MSVGLGRQMVISELFSNEVFVLTIEMANMVADSKYKPPMLQLLRITEAFLTLF